MDTCDDDDHRLDFQRRNYALFHSYFAKPTRAEQLGDSLRRFSEQLMPTGQTTTDLSAEE